jgi:uncharacterized protein YjbI with pentapeptide repeats
MTNWHSFGAISIVALLAFISIAIAGFTWLFLPRWLGKRLGAGTDTTALNLEDTYRKSLSQILGFPIAIFGLIGAYLTIASAVESYDKTATAEFQDHFRRSFDMLSSPETSTRIGGLYGLANLLKTQHEPGLTEAEIDAQRVDVLQSLAAYAVEHSLAARPNVSDPVVAQDAQTALRTIGRSNVYAPEYPVDLRGGYFFGVFAPHANLSNANLYRANFEGSDLYQAHFEQANLRKANFNGSNLTGTHFEEAGFSNTTFCPAVNFATASLMKGTPTEARMAEAHFERSTGTHVRFDGAYLPKADFNHSALVDSWFTRAELSDTTFLSATFEGGDFSFANLERADFDSDRRANGHPLGLTVLKDTNFRDTNLDHAKFGFGWLIHPNFQHAIIRGTVFAGTVIQEADFAGADLTDVRFEGVTLIKSHFEGAILHNTQFIRTAGEANLSEAINCDTTPGPANTGEGCRHPRVFALQADEAHSISCLSSATARPLLTNKTPVDTSQAPLHEHEHL